MLGSLFAASLLALQTSAFLVTPHTSFSAALAQGRHVEIEALCKECPFPVGEGKFDDKLDSWLSLNFSTEANVLTVNGEQIYPLPKNRPAHVETVLKRQDGEKSTPVPMGYALEIQRTRKFREFKELSFHFTPISVAGYPVPVPTVYLPVLMVPKAGLFIVKQRAAALPPPTASWRQCRRKPRCLRQLLVARIRSLIAAAKMRAIHAAQRLRLKGCHGKQGKHGQAKSSSPYYGIPRFSGQHHGHHGHHDSSRFAHAFSRSLHRIFVPALLGLFAGVTACALGLVVGHGIAALWIRYRRRGASRPTPDREQGDESEKEGLMVSEAHDSPPTYEEGDYGEISLPAEKE